MPLIDLLVPLTQQQPRGLWRLASSEEFGPGRQRQVAFEDNALVLLVNTLDPVARITRVAIGLRHQLPDLILSRRRR
ncbi:MAG: hypothetical protein WDO17_06150 [Alphaproteobacteria bacterium]